MSAPVAKLIKMFDVFITTLIPFHNGHNVNMLSACNRVLKNFIMMLQAVQNTGSQICSHPTLYSNLTLTLQPLKCEQFIFSVVYIITQRLVKFPPLASELSSISSRLNDACADGKW